MLRGLANERDAARLEQLLAEFPGAHELGDQNYRGATRLYRECRKRNDCG